MLWGRHKKSKMGKYDENPSLAVAEVLNKLIKNCQNCKRGFSGHQFVRLATWIISKEKDQELEMFFKTLIDRNWLQLKEFQEWHPLTDDAEAFAIRCPDHGFSVVVIKTHFELFQGNRLLYCEALPGEEGENLLAAFASIEWHPFQ
jgi:hypothetical protein